MKLFGIGESLVGLCNLQPFFRCTLLFALCQLTNLVGVVLPGQLAVCFLDLGRVEALLHIEGGHLQAQRRPWIPVLALNLRVELDEIVCVVHPEGVRHDQENLQTQLKGRDLLLLLVLRRARHLFVEHIAAKSGDKKLEGNEHEEEGLVASILGFLVV